MSSADSAGGPGLLAPNGDLAPGLGPTAGPDLTGRVAVVTGASRGLGREIALALALANAEVVVAARDPSGLDKTRALVLDRTGRPAYAVVADVSSREDVERLHAFTERRLGPAQILVNAAAMFGPLAPFSGTDPEAWIQTLMVNTIGTYLTCRIFVPAMLEAGWGRIVNISSAASLAEPEVANSAYSVSKVALNRLTRHLAAELTGTGVSAALIHPGSIKTDMWASVSDQAAALGEAGAPFRAWAQLVEQTGGDPYSSAVRLVLDLIDPGGDGRNGEFCWLEAGLETPLASW